MGVATGDEEGEVERLTHDGRSGQADRTPRDSVPDSTDNQLGLVVVFGELAEASEPLTKTEIMDRTLLPKPTVEEVLEDLEAADTLHVRQPRVDNRPRRYFLRQE